MGQLSSAVAISNEYYKDAICD